MLNQHIELVCEGIDTYSKIWVNDSLVFSTNNMFRIWRKEIKHLLRFGINEIKIEFKPVSEIEKIEAGKLPYILSNEERVFTRKDQYQYGWDFSQIQRMCNMATG
jgi:beta-mannosidase